MWTANLEYKSENSSIYHFKNYLKYIIIYEKYNIKKISRLCTVAEKIRQYLKIY